MTPAQIHRANRDAHLAAVRAANANRAHVDLTDWASLDPLEVLVVAAVAAWGRP